MEKEKRSKSKIGKLSRAAGKRFEIAIRKDLESKNWVVCKWTNTVEFKVDGHPDLGRLVQAKSKYNPFLKRVISEGSGLPDFVAFKLMGANFYEVIGVESKKAKYLDAKEKKICFWLLNNKIFNEILIAYPEKVGRKVNIIYKKFELDTI